MKGMGDNKMNFIHKQNKYITKTRVKMIIYKVAELGREGQLTRCFSKNRYRNLQ